MTYFESLKKLWNFINFFYKFRITLAQILIANYLHFSYLKKKCLSTFKYDPYSDLPSAMYPLNY